MGSNAFYRCLQCKHEWAGPWVIPTCMTLKCPQCQSERTMLITEKESAPR